MFRKNLRSKVQMNVESSSSSDSSDSSSDQDNTPRLKSASDIINSFLQRNETIQIERTNVPEFRNASDVINSFLQKKKTLTQPNRPPLRSALDVINSYLEYDVPWGNKASSKRKRTNIETIDSSTSDSDSDTSDGNAAKKRKIETSHRPVGTKSASLSSKKVKPSSTTRHDELSTDSSCDILLSEDNIRRTQTPGKESLCVQNNPKNCPGRRSTRLQTTSQLNPPRKINRTNKRAKSSSSTVNSSKPETKNRIVIRRDIQDKRDKTIKYVDFHVAILRDYHIPKPKYDRALEMLNSVESRFDETPVDYNTRYKDTDVRRICDLRRYAEAGYDHAKLVKFKPISAARILCEMVNCLQKENWQQMAKLIYFGCDNLQVYETRRDVGTTFLTYCLMLLLMDSNPTELSSFEEKRDTLKKYFIALGNESHQIDEYLKKLNFMTEECDEISTSESQLSQQSQQS